MGKQIMKAQIGCYKVGFYSEMTNHCRIMKRSDTLLCLFSLYDKEGSRESRIHLHCPKVTFFHICFSSTPSINLHYQLSLP